MPACNPADKVHYIVRFRDWRLTRPVTLALDVVLSGRVNSIIDACWHSSLPSPFRTYPKENPVLLLLGREYLNRANRPVDIFPSEQKNSNYAWSTGMCIIHIGDLPIEKIHWPETKRRVYLFYLVIQLNQWFVIGADSNNHFIRHAYFLFSNRFTSLSFINGNFLM